MNEQLRKAAPGTLEAVHRCEKCGTLASPQEVNDDVNVTGIVVCAVCGHAGPLRIEVVETSQ